MTKSVIKLTSLLFSLLLLNNCTKEYNVKLQTKWQLNTIESIGNTSVVDTIFYNFDNSVFTMQKLISTYSNEIVYGKFYQKGDSLLIIFPDPKFGGKDRLRNDFQWNDTLRHFKIMKITNSELCLQDQSSKLTFRKY